MLAHERFKYVTPQKGLVVFSIHALKNDKIVRRLKQKNFHLIAVPPLNPHWDELGFLSILKSNRIPFTRLLGKHAAFLGDVDKRGVKEVLERIRQLHLKRKRVGIFCSAGVYTSPLIAAAYLVYEKGFLPSKAVNASVIVPEEVYAGAVSTDLKNLLQQYPVQEYKRRKK